jgi:LacI family transcriptional regulator
MSDASGVAPKPRAPTRADVARYAGVSTAVVSYVGNNGPRRVAPETAARVRAAIEILKYRPNINARALKKGSTDMLGLILPDITNPFFAEYARALEVAAAAHGYVLVVANSDSNVAQEGRIVSDLSNRHVDGLIIRTVLPASGFSATTLPGRPIVLIDCSTSFVGYATVGAASREGACALVDHLITVHGYESIALIMGESSEAVQEPREQGWSDAFQAHELPPGPIVRTSFGLRGGYQGALQLLSWPTRPRAIFAASDQLCFGALKAIRELACGALTTSRLCRMTVRLRRSIAGRRLPSLGSRSRKWPMRPFKLFSIPVPLLAGYQRFDIELVIRQSCGCDGSAAPS